jgi:hypothetical protein
MTPATIIRAALSLLVALTAAVLAPAATSAAAPAGWRPVGGAGRGLLSDGARYVVTHSRSRVVRVVDTVTERRRRLETPPCDAGRSEPSALGRGMLVWECGGFVGSAGHTLVVDDLATGRRFVPPALARFRALEEPSSDGSVFRVRLVGRHWIYLTRSGYHYADDVLVGLDGPQVVYQPAERADLAIDPDRPGGTRRLCDGIRRSSGASELGEMTYGFVDYHRPYAIIGFGRVRACTGAPAAPRERVVALSDTALSWAGGSLLRIRPTASGRTMRRRAPGVVREIALTRDFVYVTTAAGAYRSRLARG